MKKLLAITALLSLAGCDYAYRYECQDPANFEKPDCKPPLCEYEGQCSGWLVGQKDPIPNAEKDAPAPVQEDVQEINEEIVQQEEEVQVNE